MGQSRIGSEVFLKKPLRTQYKMLGIVWHGIVYECVFYFFLIINGLSGLMSRLARSLIWILTWTCLPGVQTSVERPWASAQVSIRPWLITTVSVCAYCLSCAFTFFHLLYFFVFWFLCGTLKFLSVWIALYKYIYVALLYWAPVTLLLQVWEGSSVVPGIFYYCLALKHLRRSK